MNVVVDCFDINPDFIHYAEKKRNMIMIGSTFSKIVYSTPCVSMTGLYVYIPPKLDARQSMELGMAICRLEEKILETYKQSNGITKSCMYSIKTRILNGTLKLDGESNSIKLSGVWESGTSIGITYKT